MYITVGRDERGEEKKREDKRRVAHLRLVLFVVDHVAGPEDAVGFAYLLRYALQHLC